MEAETIEIRERLSDKWKVFLVEVTESGLRGEGCNII